MKSVSFLALLLALWFSSPLEGWAQQSHVEQLQSLGIECVKDVLVGVGDFEIDAGERSPYLRSAITSYWMEMGHRVFQADSASVEHELPRFQYRITDIGVDLERAPDGQVQRTTRLSLHYLLTGPDGQILADNSCSRHRVDLIDTDIINGLSDSRYVETQPLFQQRSWIQRSLSPVVIIGAAVIGTYLFFNLRSKRSNN